VRLSDKLKVMWCLFFYTSFFLSKHGHKMHTKVVITY